MIEFIIFFENANSGKDDREYRKFYDIEEAAKYGRRTYGLLYQYTQGRQSYEDLQVTIMKNKLKDEESK